MPSNINLDANIERARSYFVNDVEWNSGLDACTFYNELNGGGNNANALRITGNPTRQGVFRKPNFFILGAPKCGTTSLAVWLSEHPNIFMSPEKEPHFFNTDDRRGVTTLDQYENLFRNTRKEHIAIGEASVWYLSSSEAVSNILKYNPDARFIVMVRNPIEMAPALHGQMLLAGLESVRDFSKAWYLQEERRQGRRLPAFSWTRRRFLYGDICSVGAQLEKLLSVVSANRVLVIILDDLGVDPHREYLRVLKFLDCPDDERLEFPVYNTAVNLRWVALTRFFGCLSEIKCRLGMLSHTGLAAPLNRINQFCEPRPKLSAAMEAALKKYFRGDVERLSRLLDRDLRSWVD